MNLFDYIKTLFGWPTRGGIIDSKPIYPPESPDRKKKKRINTRGGKPDLEKTHYDIHLVISEGN